MPYISVLAIDVSHLKYRYLFYFLYYVHTPVMGSVRFQTEPNRTEPNRVDFGSIQDFLKFRRFGSVRFGSV